MTDVKKRKILNLHSLLTPWSEKLRPSKLIERIDLELEPNMRAIRLTVSIGEQLMALGVDTNSVLATSLDITETYCKQRVFFEIGYSSIIASQSRGVQKEPLTVYHFVKKRETNNRTVQQLLGLRDEIVEGLPLYDAEQRFKEIMTNARFNPHWMLMCAHAGISVGVVMFYTTSLTALIATFLVSSLVYWLIVLLNHYRFPDFFIQIAAAALIITGASSVFWLGDANLGIIPNVNGSLIAVGGIVMLVAGMTLTTTIQDAIDEFYTFSASRLVRTLMMTTGIVIGVVGSYAIINSLTGAAVTVPTAGFTLGSLPFQLLAAAITAVSWAIFTDSSRGTVAWAALLSAAGWLLYTAILWMGPVAASGLTALAIGFTGALIARRSRSPANAIVSSAIIVLVPGVLLFRAFLHFVGNIDDTVIMSGTLLMVTAIGISLAIATGASFGNYIGRPVRSQLSRVREYLPQTLPKKLQPRKRFKKII